MFSSSQNQLKDISDVYYFKLPYIGSLLHHIKNKTLKLCKEFCKENFNNEIFNSLKVNNYFSYKDQITDDLKFFPVYLKLRVLVVVLATLAKLVVILKLGCLCKRISLIFLNIYIPPQHALTLIIIFLLQIIGKANSKVDLKLNKLFTLIRENLQPFTKYLKLTLFSMWNNALQEKLISVFQQFSAISDKIFILAGRLNTRLSFYEV